MTEDRDNKLHSLSENRPHVLFFSGKGGVGKTTLAGTASVYLGGRDDQVLVASTDPAHSLSDLFDTSIGGQATHVAAGVDAMEVDASKEVDSMFEEMGPLGLKGPMAALEDLLKLASHSPGIDEVISLDLILKMLEQPSYDTVILDTAPTGHTLRLLALPDLMDRYFGRLLKWRGQISRFSRKFKKLFQLGRSDDETAFEEDLSDARSRMQMLGELLRKEDQCSVILATIPEEMSVLETIRTLNLLQRQGISVAAVAVNMVQPEEVDCRFCAGRRKVHQKQLRRIKMLVDEVPILTIEHELDEPRGNDALNMLANKIWSGNGTIIKPV